MRNQSVKNYRKFISNLKINLDFIEAFFKYLPYEKNGELKYSLTYYYEDTLYFRNVLEIISEVKRCIKYQTDEKMEIDISAEIVFEQDVIINGKEITLFYHGQLTIYHLLALINWNWYQGTPSVEFPLNSAIPPREILSIFENFQTAINDIKTKNE